MIRPPALATTPFRFLALAVLALGVALPAAPARAAQDDLVRQLIDACVGCRFPKDLHGRDLHGLRFVAADLRDADFSHANLNGAQFTGANLAGARFDDADLRNAQFVGVEFGGTSFARAKLDGVTMRGVRLTAGSIIGADSARFLRDCGGCDVGGYPYLRDRVPAMSGVLVLPRVPMIPRIDMMPPEVERSLRELERTMREHPPVIPCDLIDRSIRDANGDARAAKRAAHTAERAAREAIRGLRRSRPAIPPLPTLPPLAPIPPAQTAPAPPPAPPA
jgi:hypothetical protein